jgi:RNA polymerase sigma factor (sigma-70 family)
MAESSDNQQRLAEQFEQQRTRLRSVAYRMLGSLPEAEDAVQETWLRLSQAAHSEIENLAGWLTTVVSRVCLNVLRARGARPEELADVRVPDPVVRSDGQAGPEEEAVLADSVGLALLVVLERLAPAERVAFVLHDMFDVPFEEIATIVDRTPAAARQLASRARRRVRDATVLSPDRDLGAQRLVVDAFFAAAREGEFDALVAVLDPDVVLRIDAGALARASMVVRGADAVARQTERGLRSILARPRFELRPVVVNGSAGVVILDDDDPASVMGFTFAEDRIVEIDAIAAPDRVAVLTAGAVLKR